MRMMFYILYCLKAAFVDIFDRFPQYKQTVYSGIDCEELHRHNRVFNISKNNASSKINLNHLWNMGIIIHNA